MLPFFYSLFANTDDTAILFEYIFPEFTVDKTVQLSTLLLTDRQQLTHCENVELAF